MERQALVSVLIVNFNGGRLVEQAVGAVLRSTVPVQVIVCDNGSTDGSLPALRRCASDNPQLWVLDLGKNRGFTFATNRALAHATGRYVLLLNPDCIVQPDTLERMLHTLEEHPGAGMAGCLIRNPDGSEQAGCRRAVPTPWRALVRVFHLDRLKLGHPRLRTFLLNKDPLPDKPVPVEAVSGAFMLVRREALHQVGPLDEEYFLHCDDLDWCMRFRQAGWQVLFVPDVEVTHFKGGCSSGRTLFVEWHKHRGMVRFYRKFFSRQYPLPMMVLVLAAVWARFGAIAVHSLGRRVMGKTQRHDTRHEAPVPNVSPATAVSLEHAGAEGEGRIEPPVGTVAGEHGDDRAYANRAGGTR